MRGFMLDSARTLEVRSYYPRFLDFMAARGCDVLLWHFTDDQGCSLRFDSLPEAASPNAYTKDELRHLLDHAAKRGIEVIPELETLGHTRYITRARSDLAELAENDKEFTSLCPLHPRTREVVGTLIDEVCDLFDSVVVHVGLDEVNFGDHPLTQTALTSQSRGDLFAEYVRFLHTRLAQHGRRMMMWGDHLLKDEQLATQVPGDILVGNWQYAPEVPAETTTRLQAHGFEVVSCGAMISHDQPLFPGESFALANLRETARHVRTHATAGVITTVWTPQRFLHDALWPAVHYAVELMSDGPGVTVEDSMRRFAEMFHGFSPSDAWTQAMRTLFDRSPMRKPWLAAMKLELDDRLRDINLAEEAQRWQACHAQLHRERTNVTRECASYDALLLMVEVMAHVWERAVSHERGTLSAAIVDQSHALAARLGEQWDVERYSDDPRKRRPVFAFDADNHLLVAFERGTAVAAALASAKPA